MSTPTALHKAVEKAIGDHCAGGDLWLCAHIASEQFDARLAELERERDELRAKLAEYEQAPTVAWQWCESGHFRKSLPKRAEAMLWRELIARPTRKDGE